MTREQILQEFDQVQALLKQKQSRSSPDIVLDKIESALLWLRQQVEGQWPLPPKIASGLTLSYYATRNLDESLPDLVDKITSLEGRLERDGAD